MAKLKFNLLVSGGRDRDLDVELGHEAIRALAHAINDDIRYLELQSALAAHPAAAIRAIVATRAFLSNDAVDLLRSDEDCEVRRAVMQSEALWRRIGTMTFSRSAQAIGTLH